EVMLTAAPRRWVDVDEAIAVLNEARCDPPKPVEDSNCGGWLDGVRILDLCNVIAGPHSVTYLARFGAEVIKLDSALPSYDSGNAVVYGFSHMRGKQSLLADIRSVEGQQMLKRIIREIDVVVWNAPDDQIKNLGLDQDSIQAINPDAIFCKLDCFSGVRPGPRSNYLGYDDLVQAATGIMVRFGGSMETPEEHAHVGTIDVMCGFGGALGVATALYHKLKTGKTLRPCTSLAALSGLLQIPFCHDFSTRGPFDEPSGRDCQGYNELKRFYRGSCGGYFFLCAQEQDIAKFDLLPPLDKLANLRQCDRALFLETTFLSASARDWQSRLQSVGIGAAFCENIETLRSENSRAAGPSAGTNQGSFSFSTYHDHPSGHCVTQLDPYAIRPRRGKIYALTAAEKYGASTRSVLRDLNYTDAEIDAMIDAGSVSESWSDEYLPS
ncbi:MAG: CoA transferase, partial [Pseudomonadota bacterium]